MIHDLVVETNPKDAGKGPVIEWQESWSLIVEGFDEAVWSCGPSSDPAVKIVLSPDSPPERTCPKCGWKCDEDALDFYDDGEGYPPNIACPGSCGHWYQ